MSRSRNSLTKKDKRSGSQGRQYLKTGLLFCAVTLLLNILGYFVAEKDYLLFFNSFNAQTAGSLIRLTGLSALVQENIIQLGSAVWIVDTECTAINLINIFLAFILVYPACVRSKIIGIAVGLPLIFSANMIRLLGMAWMAKIKPDFFNYFHDYVWQVAFLILIALLWLVWIDKVVNYAAQNPVSS